MGKRKMKAIKGYSLVELLVAVIVIGILAAIVIPQFVSYEEQKLKTTSIEIGDYLARMSHITCNTQRCKSHVIIQEKTPSEEAKKIIGGSYFLFACDVSEEGHPYGDGKLDQVSHIYLKGDHPLREYTLKKVQEVYEKLMEKEAQLEAAKNADPHK